MKGIAGMLIYILIGALVFVSQSRKKTAQEARKARQQEAAQQAKAAAPEAMMPDRPVHEQPRRMMPTIKVTEHDHSGIYDGSMDSDHSGEGMDFHDHGQAPVDMPSMHSDRDLNRELAGSLREEPEREPALAMDWSSASIVRGVILQEVLGKPKSLRGRTRR